MNALSLATESRLGPQSTATFRAQLVDIDDSGALVIHVQGVAEKAQILSHLASCIRGAAHHLPVPVLVTYAEGDELPIVVGIIQSDVQSAEASTSLSRQSVIVDGERITLTAHTELELRCGKSSVRLTKDGKVTIKGARIFSRAAHTNKVKGATVQIN